MDTGATTLLVAFVVLVLVMLYRFLGGKPLKRRPPRDED
jgi:hypothetical protein